MATQRGRRTVVKEPDPTIPKVQKCVCCGVEVKKSIPQTFRKSRSMLFKYNNGYLPICRNCLVAYYEQTNMELGFNPYASIERICQLCDWYYDQDIVKAAIEEDKDQSLIETYYSKATQVQFTKRGSTYRDTIRRKNENGMKDVVIEEDDETETITVKQTRKKNSQNFVSQEMKQFWGRAYEEPLDLLMLQDHYDDLARIAEVNGYDLETDYSRQIKTKRLCELNLRIQHEITGDGKNISQLSAEYNKLFKECGFDQNNELDLTNASFGQWLKDITMLAPADVYKDPNLYKDFFGGEEYIKRFVERPMKNLFTGSKEMDAEYSIGEE